MKVDRYVDPSEFDKWKQVAENMGFLYVASGPLVRSSYKVLFFLSFVCLNLFMLTMFPRPVNSISKTSSEGKAEKRKLGI
jgi:hypothetical protein